MHQDFPSIPIVSFSNLDQWTGMKSCELELDKGNGKQTAQHEKIYVTRDVSFVIISSLAVALYLNRRYQVPVPTVSGRPIYLQDMEKQVEIWYDMTYRYVPI